MSLYTDGKMPKALNHLTRLENWESLLKLTQPESWSPNAMYKATNMFASSTKAERFYELFLLPRVREDIRIHKKLHFCLYQSLKKSLFKPKGFYCGILLPLCKVCFFLFFSFLLSWLFSNINLHIFLLVWNMHHPRSCNYREYNTQVFYSWKFFKVPRIYLYIIAKLLRT